MAEPSGGSGGYIKESDGNTAWYGKKTTSDAKYWYIDSDKNTFFNAGETGRIVFTAKAKFSQSSDVIGNLMMQTQLGDTQFGLNIPNLNVKNDADSVLKFYEEEIGKVKFNPNTWYTFEQTIDTNLKTWSVKILLPEGVVFSKTIDLAGKTEFDFTQAYKGSWDCVMIYGSGIRSANDIIYLDDIAVYKVCAMPVTAEYDSTKGALKYNGSIVGNGEETAVGYNKDATFTVEAKDGYAVDKVSVDGKDVVLNSDNSFTLSKVLSSKKIEVSFKEASVTPSVEKTQVVTNGEYNGKKCAVVYAKVTGKVTEEGVIFKDKDNNEITLPVADINGNKLTVSSFAIRVFGDGFKVGETYKFAPYIKYEGGTQTAAEESFTFGN